MKKSQKLIVTAASESYAESILALIGSLNVNWPGHPPVLVYDIGLSPDTLEQLRMHQIPVRSVPPFCPHWRKHFTWKLWCWQDAPAEQVLWMDAGLAVLGPLEEIFTAIESLGYFAVPTYFPQIRLAHPEACRCCGVAPEFRDGKMALAATLVGMDKSGKMGELVLEALTIALREECIVSTAEILNNDQALYSLLMYRYFGHPVIADGIIYLGSSSPRQVPGQKVWHHRRRIRPEDAAYFARYLSGPGPPHHPQPSREGLLWLVKNPRHLGLKIREKGLAESLKWGLRIVASELGLIKENKEKVRLGLRD